MTNKNTYTSRNDINFDSNSNSNSYNDNDIDNHFIFSSFKKCLIKVTYFM